MLDLQKVIDLVQNNDFKGAQAEVNNDKEVPSCSSDMTTLLSKLTDTDFDTATSEELQEIIALAGTIARDLIKTPVEATVVAVAEEVREEENKVEEAKDETEAAETAEAPEVVASSPSPVEATEEREEEDTDVGMEYQPSVMLAAEHGEHTPQLGASHVDETPAALLGGTTPTEDAQQ